MHLRSRKKRKEKGSPIAARQKRGEKTGEREKIFVSYSSI